MPNPLTVPSLCPLTAILLLPWPCHLLFFQPWILPRISSCEPYPAYQQQLDVIPSTTSFSIITPSPPHQHRVDCYVRVGSLSGLQIKVFYVIVPVDNQFSVCPKPQFMGLDALLASQNLGEERWPDNIWWVFWNLQLMTVLLGTSTKLWHYWVPSNPGWHFVYFLKINFKSCPTSFHNVLDNY